MKKHCCKKMANNISEDLEKTLINYNERMDEYGVPLHYGENSTVCAVITLNYCPWCGEKLPDSKRDDYFEILYDELGYEPPLMERDCPKEFDSSDWYKSDWYKQWKVKHTKNEEEVKPKFSKENAKLCCEVMDSNIYFVNEKASINDHKVDFSTIYYLSDTNEYNIPYNAGASLDMSDKWEKIDFCPFCGEKLCEHLDS